MKTAFLLFSAGILAALALFFEAGLTAQQPTTGAERWVTAWGTSQNGAGTNMVSDTTVRMIARVTISGQAVRIRLDNTFGGSPLSIGAAYIGERIQGAAVAPGSNRRLTFNKSASVSVPTGASVTSDPVRMNVL